MSNKIKFGIKQWNNQSPEWLSLTANILVIAVAPALAGLVLSLNQAGIITDKTSIILGATGTCVIAIVKGIQKLTGTNKTE